MYASRCPVCGGRVSGRAIVAADDPFKAIIDDIARQLFDAKLQDGHIPQALYEATADRLIKGMFEGIGGKPSKPFTYEDPRNSLVAHLRQNMYAFSAAKSLTQMKLFNELLVGDDGKIKTFKQFRDDVAKTGALFNITHLQTEYNMALASAQMAQAWNEFEDDDILQFSTAGDNNVRPAHAILDGTTAAKSDVIWKRIWPPLDFGCRCKIIPGIKSRVKQHDTKQLIKEADIPPQFQNNSGITKTVFTPDGPYYQDSYRNERELRFDVNYGMKDVPGLYAVNDYPKPITLSSAKEAEQWWKDQAGEDNDTFDWVDKLGTTIRFDSEMLRHVLKDNRDGRHAMIANVEDIIADPDEIWSIKEKGVLITTYIKYYEDFPQTVQVDDTRAFTAFEYSKDGKLNEKSIGRDRRGILLYRKN